MKFSARFFSPLALFLLFFSFAWSQTSGILGAELQYFHVAGNTYRFQVNYYRSCNGDPAPFFTHISLSTQAACGAVDSIRLDSVSYQVESTPLCPTGVSNCTGSGPLGTDLTVFEGTYTFPSNCGDWEIFWDYCCRANGINGVRDPDTTGVFLTATHEGDQANSSPLFTSDPVIYVCTNQSYCLPLGGADPDGDELRFRLIRPQTGPYPGRGICYLIPYFERFPFSMSGGYLSIDSLSGELCIAPYSPSPSPNVTTGVFSIEVREFRAGRLMATTYRDIVVGHYNCVNDPPYLIPPGMINNFGATVLDTNHIEICPGNFASYNFQLSDPDFSDVLTATSDIATQIPGATLNLVGTRPVNATFFWTPTAADSGRYIFTVTVQDSSCPVPLRAAYQFVVDVVPKVNAGPDLVLCPSSDSIPIIAQGGDTFNWRVLSGDFGSLSCNPCKVQRVKPSVTTTYEVGGNITGGCPNLDTITVNVSPDFSLSVTPANRIICKNDTVHLQANAGPAGGPFFYRWTPEQYISDVYVPDPIVDPVRSMTYHCEVVAANGCTISDSVVIGVNGLAPRITLQPSDTSLCQGDSIQLIPSILNEPKNCGLNPYGCFGSDSTYQVGTGTSPDVSASPFQANSLTFVVSKHQYIFTAAELNAAGIQGGTISAIGLEGAYIRSNTHYQFSIKMGCVGKDDFGDGRFIDGCGLPEVFSSKPLSLPGVAGWFSIPFDTPYDWDGVSNLVVQICQGGTTRSTPQYLRYLTYINRSPTIGVVQVGGSYPPCDQLTGTPNNRRPNFQFQVCTVSSSGPTFAWTPVTGLSDATIQSPMASPSGNTTYTLTVTDGGSGCTGQETTDITVGQNFSVNGTADTTICAGDTLPLQVTPSLPGTYSYNWSPDSGILQDSLSSIPAKPEGPLEYVVVVDNGGCIRYDTTLVSVAGFPLGISSDQNFICPGEIVQLRTEDPNDFQENFDPLINQGNWDHVYSANVNGNCGANSGSNALHFDGSGPREAVTRPLDLRICTTLDFCIVFGAGSGGGCDAPEAGEDVVLSYSVDGGNTWVQMARYDGTVINTWTCFSLPIPLQARTDSTQFKWEQVAFNAVLNADNWALDDISLSNPPCGGPYTYSWSPPGIFSDPFTENPTAVITPPDTVLTMTVTDQSNSNCPASTDLSIQLKDFATVTAGASPANPCVGDSVTLSSLVNGNAAPLPLICGVNGTTSAQPQQVSVPASSPVVGSSRSPFNGNYTDYKAQFLFRAGVLRATGFNGGTITDLGILLERKLSSFPYYNLTIGLSCTSDSVLSTSTGFLPATTVFGPASYNTTPNAVNNFAITPFDWDGTSNLVVTICFDNPNFFPPGSVDLFYEENFGYACHLTSFTSVSNSIGCSLNALQQHTYLPAMVFTYREANPGPISYLWTPPTGLSDPTAANPRALFSGDITYSVSITGGDCPTEDSISLVDCGTLPAGELEFEATKREGFVDLEWITEADFQTTRFEVEKSPDGRSFEFLTEVDARRSGGEEKYFTVDFEPEVGSNYYRLRLLNDSGQDQFSEVRQVYFEPDHGLLGLYPNPARPSHEVFVVFALETPGPVDVSLVDLTGRMVLKTRFTPGLGTHKLSVALPDLPSGTYLVQVLHGGQRYVRNLVIME